MLDRMWRDMVVVEIDFDGGQYVLDHLAVIVYYNNPHESLPHRARTRTPKTSLSRESIHTSMHTVTHIMYGRITLLLFPVITSPPCPAIAHTLHCFFISSWNLIPMNRYFHP